MSIVGSYIDHLIQLDLHLQTLEANINYNRCNQVENVSADNMEINRCYEKCTQEINSLEEDLIYIETCFTEAMKGAIFAQFDSLKTAYEGLKTKIDDNLVISETTSKLNKIYMEFEWIKGNPNQIKKLEDLKQRNISILEYPKLTPFHLKTIHELNDLIEFEESLYVEKMLGQLDDQIDAVIKRGDGIDCVRRTLFQMLPMCQLGQATQQHIFKNLWFDAGEPEGGDPENDPEWGMNHALDDLDRLSRVLRKLQLFPEERIKNEQPRFPIEDNSFILNLTLVKVGTPIEGDIQPHPLNTNHLLETLNALDINDEGRDSADEGGVISSAGSPVFTINDKNKTF